MATLDVRRLYADGDPLFQADLDAFLDDIETFVNTTKINDDNIQNAGITASDKLVDGSITAGKIGTGAVTTVKILDANVTTAKIADSNVTTAKIADSNVTTAKIADANVTTAKIADDAVTQAKLGAANYAVSASCGTWLVSSTSDTAVTNLSVSLTTTGRPVMLLLQPAGGSTIGQLADSNAASAGLRIRFRRDATEISTYLVSSATASIVIPPGGVSYLDAVAAGTYTYSVYAAGTTSTTSMSIENVILVAYEL